MNKRKNRNAPHRFLGTFELPSGASVTGELLLDGSRTTLALHSDKPLPDFQEGACLKGTSQRGEKLTLMDCVPMGETSSATWHESNVFPHHVAVGRQHLDPSQRSVTAIHFTTADLPTLFYDFDAFGSVPDARSIIDVVLRERREMRPVEAGEWPQVMYFTGKHRIVEVATVIGTVAVDHSPSQSLGGPKGVGIKNRLVASIAPGDPITVGDALERMNALLCFLSMAAGRAQYVSHIRVTMGEGPDGHPETLGIHPSYRWPASKKSDLRKPHPGDMPLDAVHRRPEFMQVLTDWMARHEGWRVARFRYLNCMRKRSNYDADRIVAAANMFDVLPSDAVPSSEGLPEALAVARDECRRILRKSPQSIDRDSALDALGRLGRPSLPKKVAHRTSMIASKLGTRFPDLWFVARSAVQMRNFYVHGGDDIDHHRKMEPFLAFLTDALEFIFAASDFITAGWDAQGWDSDPRGWSHPFARFRNGYKFHLDELRRALET